MKLIKSTQKRSYGHGVFHIDILYPGLALGLHDTGFYTIGRIDHALFRPPGIVPMHPHRDDEILSYMRKGQQTHTDSSGRTERLDDSKMMLMNAGSGISHEEHAEKDVEMLQIFMRPHAEGLEPRVQFHRFDSAFSVNKWRLVAGDTGDAALELRVQTNIFDVRLQEANTLSLPPGKDRAVYLLYNFNGDITLNGTVLGKGDSAVLENEDAAIVAITEADLVLFQIAKDARYFDGGMFSGNQNR